MTHTSPVGTSCSSRRRFAAPLLSISFFMVATGTSVLPRKSVERHTLTQLVLLYVYYISAVKKPYMSYVCVCERARLSVMSSSLTQCV